MDRRVYCFSEGRVNLIHRWFDETGVPTADRVALEAVLEIYRCGGLLSIIASTVDLGGGFRALFCHRKGGMHPCPVFCEGPFGPSEITFLAGACWNQKAKRPEPRYVAGIAEERLEALQRDRNRRRHEGFT